MLWKYKGTRKRLFGRWCYAGDIVENNTKPPGTWIQTDSKENKTIEEEIGQDTESSGIEEYRQKLSKKKMKGIRAIGYKYDCRDTDKQELIQEIINARLKRGEL